MAGLESIMERACNRVLESTLQLVKAGNPFDLRMGAYVSALKKIEKHYQNLGK